MPLTSKSRKLIPLIVSLAALALIVTGVVLTLQSLNAEPKATPRVLTDGDPGQEGKKAPELPPMTPGEKTPSELGLPQYPDAFDFHSMESGTALRSSAFLSKKGSAADISRFYILELGQRGWSLVWERDATVYPNNDQTFEPMRGTRVRWRDAGGELQVTLLALDDPRKQHSAQAVLSSTRLAALPRGG